LQGLHKNIFCRTLKHFNSEEKAMTTLRSFPERAATIDEIKRHLGLRYDTELGKLVGMSQATMVRWRTKGIPRDGQALIMVCLDVPFDIVTGKMRAA
jgi:hypothetical protein